MSDAPRNRRRAGNAGAVIHAPPDPLPSPSPDPPKAGRACADDSPVPPGATTTSVRPPPAARPAPGVLRSRAFRTLQLVAGVVVVLACSIAVAWGARRYVLSSPRFAVRTILVEGTGRRTAQEIARAAGVAVGKNIFSLDLEVAKAGVIGDPWIVDAKVTRKLPGTIQISVVEREARAMVAIGGELYLSTGDGDVFKKVAPEDPYDLPLVSGITPEQVARDRAGASLAVKRALDVVTDLERAGIAKRYPIQELHLERDGALVVTIGRDAVALHLGHAPFRAKVEQASRVLAEVFARRATPSVVFLDNDAHPERVVVRMR